MESNKNQFPEFIERYGKQKVDTFIKQLERNTNLTFLEENCHAPNLCLANSKEVRDEYRTSFGWSDLKAFLNANGLYTEKINLQDIPMPNDSSAFWEKVREGISQ
jgi:hypothetical protein